MAPPQSQALSLTGWGRRSEIRQLFINGDAFSPAAQPAKPNLRFLLSDILTTLYLRIPASQHPFVSCQQPSYFDINTLQIATTRALCIMPAPSKRWGKSLPSPPTPRCPSKATSFPTPRLAAGKRLTADALQRVGNHGHAFAIAIRAEQPPPRCAWDS